MIGKYYDLSILLQFEDDLNEIVDYITFKPRNLLATERLVDDIEKAIEERRSCEEAFEPYPPYRKDCIRIIRSQSEISRSTTWS